MKEGLGGAALGVWSPTVTAGATALSGTAISWEAAGNAFAEISVAAWATSAAPGSAALLELLQPMLVELAVGVARLPAAGALQLAPKSYLQFSELSHLRNVGCACTSSAGEQCSHSLHASASALIMLVQTQQPWLQQFWCVSLVLLLHRFTEVTLWTSY
jgi:hypothetical protein